MNSTESLIDRINQNTVYPGVKISVEDVLGNGRHAYKLSGTESLIKAIEKAKGHRRRVSSLNKALAPLRTSVIEPSSKYGVWERPDCQDWVFNRVGLPEYTFLNGETRVEAVLNRDMPNLQWIPEPEEGAVVAYFNEPEKEGKRPGVTHWGVVSEISNSIMVDSKWSSLGHAYRHPVEAIKSKYGKYAAFFRVVPKPVNQ